MILHKLRAGYLIASFWDSHFSLCLVSKLGPIFQAYCPFDSYGSLSLMKQMLYVKREIRRVGTQRSEKSLCRWHVWDRSLLIADGEGRKRVLLTVCVHAAHQGALTQGTRRSYREAQSPCWAVRNSQVLPAQSQESWEGVCWDCVCWEEWNNLFLALLLDVRP